MIEVQLFNVGFIYTMVNRNNPTPTPSPHTQDRLFECACVEANTFVQYVFHYQLHSIFIHHKTATPSRCKYLVLKYEYLLLKI